MKILILFISLIWICNKLSAQFSFYRHEKIYVAGQTISELSMSSSEKYLAYGSSDGAITIWDMDVTQQIREIEFHRGEVTALKFDHQNEYLAAGSRDRRISVWDLSSGTKVNDINAGFRVNSIAISPDNRMIVASGRSRNLVLMDFPSLIKRGELRNGHRSREVIFCSFNNNGDQILSVDEDNKMILWNPNNLNIIRETTITPNTLRGSGIQITDVGLSSDSRIIVIAFQENILAKGGNRMIFKCSIAFYDWNTGELLQVTENNSCPVNTMDVTPDNDFIVTNNSTLRETKLSFWNIQNGVIDHNYVFDENYDISNLVISDNGNWMAVGMNDNSQNAAVDIFQLSGIGGYERFDYGFQPRLSQGSRLGSSMKLTTPKEPLINIGERRKMALMHMEAVGVPDDLAKSVSYMLESRLSNSSNLILIERNQIDKVLSEMKYQMSGMTETSDAVMVGKQLNAHYVLIGSLNKLGNTLIITTKIVNIETGRIEGSRAVECSNATIEDISQMILMLAPTIAAY